MLNSRAVSAASTFAHHLRTTLTCRRVPRRTDDALAKTECCRYPPSPESDKWKEVRRSFRAGRNPGVTPESHPSKCVVLQRQKARPSTLNFLSDTRTNRTNYGRKIR